MNIEEKAKAYDEALKKARILVGYPTTQPFISDLQDLFPELAESGDERIRRELIEILEKEARDFPSSVIAEKSNSWIAWLKKQGKKGTNGNEREIPNSTWSEEDESLRLRTIGALETCKIGSPTKCVDEQINWLKSLKERVQPQPKQEWSEEDKEFTKSC